MNKLRNFVVTLPVVFSVGTAVAVSSPVSASSTCTIKPLTTQHLSSDPNGTHFVINGDGTVSTRVQVIGDANCTQDLSLVSWEAPSLSGQPYAEQKLYDHESKTFGPGTYTMTVKMPDCFYQIDLVRGLSPDNATTHSLPYETGRVQAWLHGGTHVCEEKPPVTPPTTPPTTPETPQTPVTTTPTALPNTGTGTNVAIAAVAAAVLGTAFQYVRQLRAARQS